MKKYYFIPLLITALFSTNSYSQGYVGLSVGQGDIDSDLSDFDDPTSITIMGGYRVHNNFAVEFAYVDLGEAEDDEAPVWTLEGDGFNFSAVGILPVSNSIDLFAKAGLFMWDVTLDEDGTGEIASDDGTDFSYGVGVTGKVAGNFGLTLEYQVYDLDGDDYKNLSVGVRYLFDL